MEIVNLEIVLTATPLVRGKSYSFAEMTMIDFHLDFASCIPM